MRVRRLITAQSVRIAIGLLFALLCLAFVAATVSSYWTGWELRSFFPGEEVTARSTPKNYSLRVVSGEVQLSWSWYDASEYISDEEAAFVLRGGMPYEWSFGTFKANDSTYKDGFRRFGSDEGNSDFGHGTVDRYRVYFAPLAAVTVTFAVASLLLLYGPLRSWRREKTFRCASCGYDLRATPDRCPECGAGVPSPGTPS